MFIARDKTAPHCYYSSRSTNPHAQPGRKSYLMANTFPQIYIQTVFAVSGLLSLIMPNFKEELHRRRSFRDEYLTLLKKFEIDFKEEYVFEFYD